MCVLVGLQRKERPDSSDTRNVKWYISRGNVKKKVSRAIPKKKKREKKIHPFSGCPKISKSAPIDQPQVTCLSRDPFAPLLAGVAAVGICRLPYRDGSKNEDSQPGNTQLRLQQSSRTAEQQQTEEGNDAERRQ